MEMASLKATNTIEVSLGTDLLTLEPEPELLTKDAQVTRGWAKETGALSTSRGESASGGFHGGRPN